METRPMEDIAKQVTRAMDPKGKAPTPIYDIINLEGHSKKQKAHVTDSFVVVRSPKEVKTIVMTGVETATTTMGVSMPVVVDDFDLADMEMAMRLREAAHLKVVLGKMQFQLDPFAAIHQHLLAA
uniref:Uncharacterized protein n=1 Tax=Zea mays TaxID=4577 RepID=A0A804R4N1_MAIZE